VGSFWDRRKNAGELSVIHLCMSVKRRLRVGIGYLSVKPMADVFGVAQSKRGGMSVTCSLTGFWCHLWNLHHDVGRPVGECLAPRRASGLSRRFASSSSLPRRCFVAGTPVPSFNDHVASRAGTNAAARVVEAGFDAPSEMSRMLPVCRCAHD